MFYPRAISRTRRQIPYALDVSSTDISKLEYNNLVLISTDIPTRVRIATSPNDHTPNTSDDSFLDAIKCALREDMSLYIQFYVIIQHADMNPIVVVDGRSLQVYVQATNTTEDKLIEAINKAKDYLKQCATQAGASFIQSDDQLLTAIHASSNQRQEDWSAYQAVQREIEARRAAQNVVPQNTGNARTCLKDIISIGDNSISSKLAHAIKQFEVYDIHGAVDNYKCFFRYLKIIAPILQQFNYDFDTLLTADDRVISDLSNKLKAVISGARDCSNLRFALDSCISIYNNYTTTVADYERLSLSEAEVEVDLLEAFPMMSIDDETSTAMFTTVYKPFIDYADRNSRASIPDDIYKLLRYTGTQIIFQTKVRYLRTDGISCVRTLAMHPHAHYNCLGSYPTLFRRCNTVDELVACFIGYLNTLNLDDATVQDFFIASLRKDSYTIIVDGSVRRFNDALAYVKEKTNETN